MKKICCSNQDTALEHMEGIGPNPISGHPVTHVWRCFIHHSGLLTAGIWTYKGGIFEIFAHPSNEMCTLLEGQAVIEHEDGSKETVVPGDSFIIPYGVHTISHVEGYVKKSFVCSFHEDSVFS